ncbi:hypothetical protein MMC09_006802 [Bachmanniomyces sp. S44760]|nr:hypothetical protein [Bachmanniomyces sp. S44760]
MAGLQEGSSSLTSLNATMRRIDLICKLAAPVFVALIVAAFGSNRCCVLTIAGMNCISWGIEALTAYQVWRTTPRLQERRDVLSSISSVTADTRINNSLERFNNVAAKAFEDQIQRLKQYFASDVWIPSVALAMLHISVLSYSATLITYLLNSGFSVTLITTARASSSVVEISSTFVAPVGVSYLAKSSKRHDQAEEDFEGLLEEVDDEGRMHSAGLERLGLWGIWSQLLNLLPVFIAIDQIHLSQQSTNPANVLSRFLSQRFPRFFASLSMPILTLFTFLSFSRLGLWLFDLTTTELTQTLVSPGSRSSFAGTEMSFVNVFELGQWVLAAVFSNPEDFIWLAGGSICAVGIAAGMYALWVRRRRGHLMHWEKVGAGCGCQK